MDLRSSFIDRHIGPNDYQTNSMLLELGYQNLSDFISAVVPKNILLKNEIEKSLPVGISDLERITLVSDGASIYECTSADDIVDLLQGGQGVFGIAIGKVWHEVEGSLLNLQGENTQDGSAVTSGVNNDELAERRKRKGA
jgi:hypothetical protein